MNEQKLEYLQHCVSENLNHARHVENERLTFTSIYIAMVIGAVAVVFGLENNYVACIVSGALFGFSVMAFQLNARWQGVFDDHTRNAQRCQELWLQAMENPDSVSIDIKNYCYTYHSRPKERRARWLWLMGYSMADDLNKFKYSDLFKRTRHLFSVLFALVAGVTGLVISYYLGTSSGAAISLVLALIFAVTFCFRKGRG